MSPQVNRPADLPASGHYASTDIQILGGEYAYNWSTCVISPGYAGAAKSNAAIAIKNRAQYEAIEQATNCPWFFIAALHCREASFNFNANLANGDPWNQVTTHVPIGRGPFKSFVDAAIDALGYEGFVGKTDWSLQTVFYRLEKYNGVGYRVGGQKKFVCHAHYRHGQLREGTGDFVYAGSMQDTTPRNASPYIHNGTPFYQSGISIEDHSFYPNAKDENIGCMALLKAIEIQLGIDLFASLKPAAVVKPVDARVENFSAETFGDVATVKAKLLALAAGVGCPATAIQHLMDFYDQSSQKRYWSVVNFKTYALQKRLFIFDVEQGTVETHLVAHGSGSDPKKTGYALYFSNTPQSEMSSLGICKTAELYVGVHGRSMRLDGLEATNSNLRLRDIVVHSAKYVNEAVGHEVCGRSNGCLALDPSVKDAIIDKLQGGSLINGCHE